MLARTKKFIFYSLIFTSTASLALFTITLNSSGNSDVQVEIIDSLSEEILYWEELAARHPTYTDAYLEIAKVNALKGDALRAWDLAKKAGIIDSIPYKTLSTEAVLGATSF